MKLKRDAAGNVKSFSDADLTTIWSDEIGDNYVATTYWSGSQTPSKSRHTCILCSSLVVKADGDSRTKSILESVPREGNHEGY